MSTARTFLSHVAAARRPRAASTEEARSVAAALRIGIPAVVVGVGSGLAAVVFRWLIAAATRFFTGTDDYSATTGHPAHPWLPWLGGAFVVIAPAVGGLVYGPLVARFAPEARGHGVPEVMYAVARSGGRIRPQVAVVKAIASAVTIGSGGSVGREGPIIQIGSALGSTLGRALRMPEDRLRMLVACGAAGAIAATFNAPVAGVFFALELILREFTARAFGVVVVSSITASVVGRAFLGDQPFLHLPAFSVTAPPEYLLFALLGAVAGLVGGGFTRLLYAIEDLADLVWHGPEWLRPVVGGLLLGVLLLFLPQMYGVGYPVLTKGVTGGYVLGFLLLLMVGKMVATSLTLAIGGSGGVFAPSLFIGAMLGAAFGQVVGDVWPALAGQAGAFAVVGMGAVMAGTTRAPITAGLMLFEITGDYSVILPLLLAIVVATAASRMLGPDTIYTLKLRRRGVDLDAASVPVPSGLRVADLMERPVRSLDPATPLADGARLLLAARHAALPIVGPDGEYRGIVTVHAVTEALSTDEGAAALTVADVRQEVTPLAGDTPVAAVLAAVAHEADGVPVVDDAGQVQGWLGQAALLRTLAGRALP